MKRPLLFCLTAATCFGQTYFVSAQGGISTLSADASTRVGAVNAISLYTPENGPAVNVAGGVHLNDWFSVQGNYIWNRNDLTVSEFSGLASYQQLRHSSEHAAIADLLLYFRPRRSRIRPYLSAGSGAVWLRSSATAAPSGSLVPPPPQVDSVKLPLRVAVGVDLMWRHGWGFRYSFSETMTRNPFSATLDPAGSRRLANFQNLFGFVKYL